MTTTERTIWSFDKTGTTSEIESQLRRENFGGDKNALAFQRAAIEYLAEPRENGVRVALKEGITPTGHRYVEMVIVDVSLLLEGGEEARQHRAREM